MGEPLSKNPVGNNLEVLYSTVIDVGAVTAPSVGSFTFVDASELTTITNRSGFILVGSIQFEGDTKTYPLPTLQTMSSGGDGGELTYTVLMWAEQTASTGYALQINISISNYLSTLYLPASKVTVYILRVAASPAE